MQLADHTDDQLIFCDHNCLLLLRVMNSSNVPDVFPVPIEEGEGRNQVFVEVDNN
jgi:hypothetical protein